MVFIKGFFNKIFIDEKRFVFFLFLNEVYCNEYYYF